MKCIKCHLIESNFKQIKCLHFSLHFLINLIQFSAQHNASKVIDDLLEGYDKRFRPNYGGK